MITDSVTLVIPGRNCAKTIGPCLDSVVPLLRQKPASLREILFVDDGSTDGTNELVKKFPVTYVPSRGKGAGAARNVGWRAARGSLIWFMDSDCVAEPDALGLLLAAMNDAEVGGVSGSYGIMNPQYLLACLIHEEIVERHGRMPQRVNFLATFNVLYRRAALEQVGGFDERYLKAQDAELSFRVMGAGYGLRFVFASRVKHHHPSRWLRYLRTQRQQGYWRVWLHMAHRGHAIGDSYSNLVDHLQPPLAMLALLSAPLMFLGPWVLVPSGALVLLAAAQVPLTFRLVRRLRRFRYFAFGAMSFVRAFWRGAGMIHGVLGYVTAHLRGVRGPR